MRELLWWGRCNRGKTKQSQHKDHQSITWLVAFTVCHHCFVVNILLRVLCLLSSLGNVLTSLYYPVLGLPNTMVNGDNQFDVVVLVAISYPTHRAHFHQYSLTFELNSRTYVLMVQVPLVPPCRKAARGFGRGAKGVKYPKTDQSYKVIRILPFLSQTRPLFVLLILSTLGTRPVHPWISHCWHYTNCGRDHVLWALHAVQQWSAKKGLWSAENLHICVLAIFEISCN